MPGRPDRLWGPPSLLEFETDHLSSDEVAADARSSSSSLIFFYLKEHALSLTCWILGASVIAGISIVRIGHHRNCQWPVHSSVYHI